MDQKRRNFLKAAGISTLAGLGAGTGLGRFMEGFGVGEAHAASPAKSEAATTGKRWGMLIDVRKFQEDPGLGDKVVRACHREHNVPDFPDKKDQIKWIWMTGFERAFPEQPNLYRDEAAKKMRLPILCNHCDNPPCVRVCPTQATFKNRDGIVVMDFHRCIGCRFCMAACPYGSRSFNWRDPREAVNAAQMNRNFPTRMRGVVEKCNFCAERLRNGLQPACVEACGESGAIVFGDLNDPNSGLRKLLKENHTVQRNPSLGTHPSVFYIL